ncbi:MAG: ATP-binding protein, partial [Desulfobacterales bacterium]|nr:ATP-binding protein [Desulfobacterales bacterium]
MTKVNRRTFMTVGHFGCRRKVHTEIEDLIVQKTLENQLVQVQKLESIGQLAAGIAHEINTPTQYVGDNTRFLRHAFNNLSEVLGKYGELIEAIKSGTVEDDFIREVQKKVEEINVEYLMKEIPPAIQQTLEGIERIAKVVLAMKDFLHPGTTDKTDIDINKAIENTITLARNEWNYVAELVTEFDLSLPLVPCLPGEFKQVILNMIINAAQAIAELVDDGSTGKGIITVGTSTDGDWVEIRISDTGAGIPKAFRTRIFDPFFTT